jgi:hypothetical protein
LIGYIVISVIVTTVEEMLVYAFGGVIALAQPILWVDLTWVNLVWLAWLLPWYLLIQKFAHFSRWEALMIGGTSGIFFEVILSRVFLGGAILTLMWIPLAWVIYATVFLIPLQLLEFRTGPTSSREVAFAIIVPWAWSGLVGICLWVVFAIAGIPLH